MLHFSPSFQAYNESDQIGEKFDFLNKSGAKLQAFFSKFGNNVLLGFLFYPFVLYFYLKYSYTKFLLVRLLKSKVPEIRSTRDFERLHSIVDDFNKIEGKLIECSELEISNLNMLEKSYFIQIKEISLLTLRFRNILKSKLDSYNSSIMLSPDNKLGLSYMEGDKLWQDRNKNYSYWI